ncbi:hypothetical protein Tco_0178851 [Tanacetum coccineum]
MVWMRSNIQKREYDKRKKHAGNMSVEELIAWAEKEAKSPYLRFATFDIVNDATKILDGMSASKNDASKYVEYIERLTDGINEGMNEGMDAANNDLDEQVLSKQKKLNKGKSKLIADDIAISKKRKIASKGNGISIRENDGQNVVLTDSESDSSDHAYQNSESDSDHSDKSFDYLSDGENELIELRKRMIQSKVNGTEVPNEVHFDEVPHVAGDEGTSAQGHHTIVDVDKFGEIDDTGVGLTPLIREHEKYMEALFRKLKGNEMGITDPFVIVEESKEKYPIYYDLTH